MAELANLPHEHLEKIRRILAERAPWTEIWACGDAMWGRLFGCDLLLVIIDGPAYPRTCLYPLEIALRGSGLPISVGLTIWSRTPWQREIAKDHIVLQAGEKTGWLKRCARSKILQSTGQFDFLDRRIPFVDAVFRSQPDPAALDEAARLLHEAEIRHGVGMIDCPGIITGCASRCEGPWVEQSLMPFLQETHLLLSGGDQQLIGLCDADGCDRMASWREWGGIMADWADMEIKSSPWGPNWHYMAFYSDVPVDATTYGPWRDALFRVICQKSLIYGWAFSPELSEFTARDLKAQYWNHGKAVAVRSQARPLPPATGPNGIAAMDQLGTKIREHVVANQEGRFYPSGTHFVLSGGPDTVLWSAGAFISNRHGRPPKSSANWIEAVPDLVIEARSESDINRRLDEKIGWWIEAGASRAWVLDAEHQRIEVHESGQKVQMLRKSEVLSGDQLLLEFALPVEAVFAAS